MAAVTPGQLNKARKELEQQPGMTATKGYELLSARFGVTPRYIRRLFSAAGLAWNIPEKAPEKGCKQCGEPVFCKSMCTRHYFQQRRKEVGTENIMPCAARLLLDGGDKHEWMPWKDDTVCVLCRETKKSSTFVSEESKDVSQ
jgi:hypothetical protein